MKRFTAVLVAVLMFSSTAYAQSRKDIQPYKDREYIKENSCFEVNMGSCTYSFNGKNQAIDTFEFMNTKYVPVRDMADFFGKEVTYDSYNNRIYMNEKQTDTQTTNSSTGEGGTAYLSNVDIYYRGFPLAKASNSYSGEVSGYSSGMEVYYLNLNNRVYVPLKLFTETLGLLRMYDGDSVYIDYPSDRLKIIPNAKVDYIDHYGKFEGDERDIDQSLIDEALRRQWCHYSEPKDIEMKYRIQYYDGILGIVVEVSTLNDDGYLIQNFYEIVR